MRAPSEETSFDEDEDEEDETDVSEPKEFSTSKHAQQPTSRAVTSVPVVSKTSFSGSDSTLSDGD